MWAGERGTYAETLVESRDPLGSDSFVGCIEESSINGFSCL